MKKKVFIFISIFLSIIVIGFLVQQNLLSRAGVESDLDIHVKGTSIVYDGPMASEGVEKVKRLYTKKIDRLIINSPGGEINIGMDLGEWVYDKGLDVEVKHIAFSSAANYVFTAGKNKYIHKDSMIGWHGGVTQENNNIFMNIFMKKYIKKGKEREATFFKKIGVDQKSTVYGQRDEFNEYSEEHNYVGWTYSLESMEKLGIKNIKLIDGEWNPASEYNGKKIFTITDIKEK